MKRILPTILFVVSAVPAVHAQEKKKCKINFLILLLLFSPVLTFAQTASLQGKWKFLTLTENGVDISLPDSGEDRWMRFDKNGKFFSSIACNNLSGKYSPGKQRTIKFSSMITTVKRCFDEEAKIEQSLARLLKIITKYRIKGGVLTLQDASGTNVATLTR